MISRAILGLLLCRAKQGSQFGRVKIIIDDALLPKALSKGLSVLPNCAVNHLLDLLHLLNSTQHSTNGKDLVRVPCLVNLHVGQYGFSSDVLALPREPLPDPAAARLPPPRRPITGEVMIIEIMI